MYTSFDSCSQPLEFAHLVSISWAPWPNSVAPLRGATLTTRCRDIWIAMKIHPKHIRHISIYHCKGWHQLLLPQFDHCDLELLDDKLPGNHTNCRWQHGGNMSTGFGNQDKTLQEQSGYPTGQSKSQSLEPRWDEGPKLLSSQRQGAVVGKTTNVGKTITRRRLARERKKCFSSSSEDGSRKR